jgi:hypothetical protein
VWDNHAATLISSGSFTDFVILNFGYFFLYSPSPIIIKYLGRAFIFEGILLLRVGEKITCPTLFDALPTFSKVNPFCERLHAPRRGFRYKWADLYGFKRII